MCLRGLSSLLSLSSLSQSKLTDVVFQNLYAVYVSGRLRIACSVNQPRTSLITSFSNITTYSQAAKVHASHSPHMEETVSAKDTEAVLSRSMLFTLKSIRIGD